jgi:hypothetical protein
MRSAKVLRITEVPLSFVLLNYVDVKRSNILHSVRNDTPTNFQKSILRISSNKMDKAESLQKLREEMGASIWME